MIPATSGQKRDVAINGSPLSTAFHCSGDGCAPGRHGPGKRGRNHVTQRTFWQLSRSKRRLSPSSGSACLFQRFRPAPRPDYVRRHDPRGFGGIRNSVGIVVVTIDPAAADIAALYGAEVWSEGAQDGHTGAVLPLRTRLARQRDNYADDAWRHPACDCGQRYPAPGGGACQWARLYHCSAHDKQGSNAIACSPATAVPLRFGPTVFFLISPRHGMQSIKPLTVELPTIALDIDEPSDLDAFMRIRSETSNSPPA